MTTSFNRFASIVRPQNIARRRAVSSLVALTTALGGLATAVAAHADTVQPDYANVANPLVGMPHLLRDDDVVMSFGSESDVTSGAVNSLSSISTTSKTFGTWQQDIIAACGERCDATYSNFNHDGAPVVGRFFRTGQDAVVELPTYFVPKPVPPGWQPDLAFDDLGTASVARRLGRSGRWKRADPGQSEHRADDVQRAVSRVDGHDHELEHHQDERVGLLRQGISQFHVDLRQTDELWLAVERLAGE